MAGTATYFEVDHAGLAQILERRGKEFVVAELWQNARDEDVTEVSITLLDGGRGLTRVTVEDDSPDGWRNLRDAYTLFAPSYKKNDPLKAGRFNLGEKLVLAIAKEAEIVTTTGTVTFGPNGRTAGKTKTERGSVFTALLKMTKPEREASDRLVRSLLVPDGITLTLNGETIPHRRPVITTEHSLATEIADAEGNLKPTTRRGIINVYDPLPGETGTLYELGIPVIETGDRWHVSVEQKVPVSLDRTGLVTPGYLRDVRAIVLNLTADALSETEATERWVSSALEDDLVEPEAVKAIVALRYGDDAVVYDPSDKEANRIAASQGRTVIHGGAFSGAAWKHVRAAEAVKPAGQVTPSPKPFAPDGSPLQYVDPGSLDEYAGLLDYITRFAEAVLGYTPTIRLTNDPDWSSRFRAAFGPASGLTYSVVSAPILRGEKLDDLLIHEFAHQYGSHLSHEYDHALSRVGAKAIQAVREGRI